MNEKYKNYEKYIKYSDLREKEWKVTGKQFNLVSNLSREIQKNEQTLINALGENMIMPIFLKQLLYFEQNRNSNIEGSQTQFDELFDASHKFSDFMTWETRNLIDVAIELFQEIDKGFFYLNFDAVIALHKKLYTLEKNKMNMNTDLYLDRKKPGYVLSEGDPVNWIGLKTEDREEDLKNATLIPVIPEEKKGKLAELILNTRKLIDNNELTIMDISRFHVLFEGIHPFADGNGRLGRLLVLALLKINGVTNNTILPISEYIYKNKRDYIKQLNNAQVTGDFHEWNFYFINILLESKKIHEKIINKSVDILETYKYLKKIPNKWQVFLKFFKHIKLKKDITVNKLVAEGFSQTTAYRLFDRVVEELNIKKENDYYVFKEMWEIYKD